MLKLFADFILKLIGWHFDDRLPAEKKFIVLGAPHTTNWDLPITLLCFWSTQKHISWVGKKQLFIGPLSYFFRALGGIPVDRSASTGFINQIADQFDITEEMILAIAPEGTRSKTDYWKTGFYYIALTAKVPICLAYVDYPNRTSGFGDVIIPSGDIHQDFEKIKLFYKDKTGKIPENQGEIKIKDR
jgi:1-acyl-sn-glycerol-3-phosphate acyltransferase